MRTEWELDTSAASFVTPGSGTVEFVDNETFRKEGPAVFEQVRRSRPGMIGRDDFDWDLKADLRRGPEGKPWHGFRLLCRDDDGVAQGYACYTVKEHWADFRPRSTAEVSELCAASPSAEARLWRFLAELDLIATVSASDRPLDELLPWLLVDGRAVKQVSLHDFVWVRPLDVPALLGGAPTPPRVEWCSRSSTTSASPVARSPSTPRRTGPAARRRRSRPISRFLWAPSGRCPSAGRGWRRSTPPAGSTSTRRGAVAVADALFAGAVAPWCNTWF